MGSSHLGGTEVRFQIRFYCYCYHYSRRFLSILYTFHFSRTHTHTHNPPLSYLLSLVSFGSFAPHSLRFRFTSSRHARLYSFWWDGARHLVPMLDFVNSDNGASSNGRVHSTRPDRTRHFAVSNALRPFSAGAEIVTSYGLPNFELLLKHCFILRYDLCVCGKDSRMISPLSLLNVLLCYLIVFFSQRQRARLLRPRL